MGLRNLGGERRRQALERFLLRVKLVGPVVLVVRPIGEDGTNICVMQEGDLDGFGSEHVIEEVDEAPAGRCCVGEGFRFRNAVSTRAPIALLLGRVLSSFPSRHGEHPREIRAIWGVHFFGGRSFLAMKPCLVASGLLAASLFASLLPAQVPAQSKAATRSAPLQGRIDFREIPLSGCSVEHYLGDQSWSPKTAPPGSLC